MRKRGLSVIALTLVFAMLAQISVSAEYVKIEKYTNGEKISEYTGEASEYSDFDASLFDFKRYGAGVLFDFDSNDVYYAYPSEAENAIASNTAMITSQPSDGITVFPAIYNDNGYIEKGITGSMTFEATLRNQTQNSADFRPILAIYDNTAALKDVILADAISVGAGAADTASIALPRGKADDGDIVKAMIWNGDMTYPYTAAAVLTDGQNDFYGNSLSTATLISDIQKPVNGNIDYEGDADYIRFTAPQDGNYAIKCISVAGITADLYSSNLTVLESGIVSSTYTLTAGGEYYIRASGALGGYLLSVQPVNSDSFNIYEFDIETNSYRSQVDNLCKKLYDNGEKELSKQIYEKLQRLIIEDTKLHALPDFLENAPKDFANFDNMINLYYSALYDEFMTVKQGYMDLINEGNTEEVIVVKKDEPNGGNYDTEEPEELEPAAEASTRAVPSLDILEVGTDRVRVNARFPYAHESNSVYVIDFTYRNGEDMWRKTDITYSRERTIDKLRPGRRYIIVMQYAGGNICRKVMTKYDTEEVKETYSGRHVDARLETADKAGAKQADFNTWLERMDLVYEALGDLTGNIPDTNGNMVIESTREDLSKDIQDGFPTWEIIYGHSGSPIMFSRPHYASLMTRLSSGDWGDTPIHELSHNFDLERWTFDSEALAFLKMYYVIETLRATVYRSDVATYRKSSGEYESGWFTGDKYYNFLASKFYKGNSQYFDKGIYSGASLAKDLIDIEKEIGWEPFKKTFRYFQSLSDAQVRSLTDGEKLLIFLTKLKDYSGKNVLRYISAKDKTIIENQFGITMDYIVAPYAELNTSERSVLDLDMEGAGDLRFQFTPQTSANYYLYTKAYGGTGMSNDTYIEVYDNPDFLGTPTASNDDHDGGRFSQISIPATQGYTYYVRVRHYNGGRIHARLNITEYVPVTKLADGEYTDVNVSAGDYTMYSFTPEASGTYTFYAEDNGYDTYLKLYSNKTMSRLIGNNADKIILWLDKGNTYYLQFSGYFMVHAKARVGVRSTGTLEFKKRTDSGFIFVNYPELITRYDILDGESRANQNARQKIFEQKDVKGKNIFYETHTAWYGNEPEIYEPEQSFYVDVDFYNPTSSTVYIDIENLVYGNNEDSNGNGSESDENSYRLLKNYYTGQGISGTIIIPPKEHRLLLHTLEGQSLLNTDIRTVQNRAWARIMVLLFDFNIRGNGSVSVSTLAAYNPDNMQLKYGESNKAVIDSVQYYLDHGDISVNYSEDRRNEPDSHGKYKGYAKNQGGWIDADLEFLITEDIQPDTNMPIRYKDSFYEYGIHYPNYSWISSANPFNRDDYFALNLLPSGLHDFTYAHSDTGRVWYFDFLHQDIQTAATKTGHEMNYPISEEKIETLKRSVQSGRKEGYDGQLDMYSLSMGQWGVTYHYTITLRNECNTTRTAGLEMCHFDSLIFGSKEVGTAVYDTEFVMTAGFEDWWRGKEVTIPPKSTVTFEAVMMTGGGNGGIISHIKVD